MIDAKGEKNDCQPTAVSPGNSLLALRCNLALP
jgi:hypothetical protein